MTNYIDGFVLPIPEKHLETYKSVSETGANVWKEHGALAYNEFVGDDMSLEGTRSFLESTNAKSDEVIIFGWVEFDSKESRDLANERVASDPRMTDIIAPLVIPTQIIFDPKRMVFGGFKPLVQ